jgi:hypothetical protein
MVGTIKFNHRMREREEEEEKKSRLMQIVEVISSSLFFSFCQMLTKKKV